MITRNSLGMAADLEMRTQWTAASEFSTDGQFPQEERARQIQAQSFRTTEEASRKSALGRRRYIAFPSAHRPLRSVLAERAATSSAFLWARLGERIIAQRGDALLLSLSPGEAEELRAIIGDLVLEEDLQYLPLYSPLATIALRGDQQRAPVRP